MSEVPLCQDTDPDCEDSMSPLFMKSTSRPYTLHPKPQILNDEP